jgi:Rrf2 family transcriptional regulator, iron-sulfur cluster assembly transcription factor
MSADAPRAEVKLTSREVAEVPRTVEVDFTRAVARAGVCDGIAYSQRNYLNRPTFPFMTILPRRGLLAIAAVIDVALQTDGGPISAKTLARRHGLPARHLESVLQSLVRDGILKGIRGPHGGYELARDRRGVTANDILRAAGTVHEGGEAPNSEFVAKVVLPVLSVAEQEFGQVLSRISLEDMVQRVQPSKASRLPSSP